MTSGNMVVGRRFLLSEVVREMEVLVSAPASEADVKSALMIALGLLKEATGYKTFPDVSGRSGIVVDA